MATPGPPRGGGGIPPVPTMSLSPSQRIALTASDGYGLIIAFSANSVALMVVAFAIWWLKRPDGRRNNGVRETPHEAAGTMEEGGSRAHPASHSTHADAAPGNREEEELEHEPGEQQHEHHEQHEHHQPHEHHQQHQHHEQQHQQHKKKSSAFGSFFKTLNDPEHKKSSHHTPKKTEAEREPADGVADDEAAQEPAEGGGRRRPVGNQSPIVASFDDA